MGRIVQDATGELVELHAMSNPHRVEHAISDFDPSMTRQEFADECDINQIMERAERDGVAWPPPNPNVVPYYYDFQESPGSLQEALQQVMDAGEAFMKLTAAVRREFDNDPVRFVEYASDPKNLEQMRAWGLAKPAERPPGPVKVEVVPSATPSPSIVPEPPKAPVAGA